MSGPLKARENCAGLNGGKSAFGKFIRINCRMQVCAHTPPFALKCERRSPQWEEGFRSRFVLKRERRQHWVKQNLRSRYVLRERRGVSKEREKASVRAL
ncbi:Hypothetical predicted protein [Pelobates cultripes]|nr:Hypothetical predicted protein [Pelobates cultripes]